jgi:predicted nucleotidyltransferase
MVSTKERKILDQVVAVLRKHYGERLSRVVLFGSRARRDHREDSDYDILVVLNGEFDARTERKAIVYLVIPLELDNDVLTFCHVVSENTFQQGQSNLMMNARKEGVVL